MFKRILPLLLLLAVTRPASADFQTAALVADQCLALHNGIAGQMDSLATATFKWGDLEKAPDSVKVQVKKVQFLGMILGQYRMAYKRYCEILQTLQEMEQANKQGGLAPEDQKDRADLWQHLPDNQAAMEKVSFRMSALARQAGLWVPPSWTPVDVMIKASPVKATSKK